MASALRTAIRVCGGVRQVTIGQRSLRFDLTRIRGSRFSKPASLWKSFSTQTNPSEEAKDDEREPWMFIDERIKPKSRPVGDLVQQEWPAEEEAEREFVGEFMRSSKDFIQEQEKLKAVKPEFYAKIRHEEQMNKHESKRLRDEGKLPCLIYGRTKNHRYKPLPIALEERQILKQMKHHGPSFFGRKEGILVKPQQIQYHPVTRKFESLTFVRWSPGKKTRVILPVQVIGQRDCIGVKNGGAIIRPVKGVKCVYDGPGPLPRVFKLNVQSWGVGHKFYVKDLVMPEHTRLRRPEVAHTQVLVSIIK
eukprot:jgi/Bigna1/89842/estExt_fgenesh1_pg.C_560103